MEAIGRLGRDDESGEFYNLVSESREALFTRLTFVLKEVSFLMRIDIRRPSVPRSSKSPKLLRSASHTTSSMAGSAMERKLAKHFDLDTLALQRSKIFS